MCCVYCASSFWWSLEFLVESALLLTTIVTWYGCAVCRAVPRALCKRSGCAECAVQAVSATSAVTPRSPTPPLASGQSFLFPTLGKQIIQSLREKHMWRIISISFLFKTAMNPSSQTNKEGFNVSDSASGCRMLCHSHHHHWKRHLRHLVCWWELDGWHWQHPVYLHNLGGQSKWGHRFSPQIMQNLSRFKVF